MGPGRRVLRHDLATGTSTGVGAPSPAAPRADSARPREEGESCGLRARERAFGVGEQRREKPEGLAAPSRRERAAVRRTSGDELGAVVRAPGRLLERSEERESGSRPRDAANSRP